MVLGDASLELQLFGQIELLAKSTGNFGELCLALVIGLRILAD